MRITSISGAGVLSFDRFKLALASRLTFVVGPNGAGKSNIARLLRICQSAVERGDGGAGDTERMLASFVGARHVFTSEPAIEARVGVRLTDEAERGLVVEFVRAVATGAITQDWQVQNIADLDAWADSEITDVKLAPLMEGEIVASHPGTPDGQWQCWYEFMANGHDELEHRYRWYLLGWPSATIVRDDVSYTGQGGADMATRLIGNSNPPPGMVATVPSGFSLLDLLPHSDMATTSCKFELRPQIASASQRRFAQKSGLPLVSPSGSRTVTMARVLRVILRMALVHTSDVRLLPSGGVSWSSSDLTLTSGAEARLPDLMLRLKNGDPAQRAQYRRLQDRFAEFTQGRRCDVRLIEMQQPAGPNGEPGQSAQVPVVFVTVDVSPNPQDLAPEVRIDFAGAGAWEALVLASVLSEQAASVVFLDEPAVALHHNTQRKLVAGLEAAVSQFVVISHSAELMPLSQDADAQIVRFERGKEGATRAWPVDKACRDKIARKLAGTGNERLPFASQAILCEGQDDVDAVNMLCERMGIDVRQQNVAVINCGSRENLPDYIWFCSQLGLRYLAVQDADASKPDAQPKAQAVREVHKRIGGGELAEFPECLEITFKVVKQKPSLVPGAVQALPFVGDMPDPTQVPTEVVELAEKIRRLVA